MIVGCYTLDLYCDSKREHHYQEDNVSFGKQYTGRNERECWQQARADGWKKQGVYAFCPKCVALWRDGEMRLVPKE